MSDYSVAQAKDNLPQLLREAEAGLEVRVTRRGSPVAVLISAQKYTELTSGRASFTERYRSFREKFESVDVDPDEVFEGAREPTSGRDFAW